METLQIGQILISEKEHTIETCMGNELVIPAGNEVIVGADGYGHHLNSGLIQSLGDAKIEGYDTEGIAEYLWEWLSARLPTDEWVSGWDLTDAMIIDTIECALDEMGF